MVVYLPQKDYDLPNLDLLSLIFSSPEAWTDEDTVLHAEASDTSNCINKSQTRAYTKRLAYHLRNTFGIGKNGPGKDVVVSAGGIYSAASSAFTPGELTRQVKQGKSDLIVASKDCQNVAIKTAKKCGIALHRVLILDSMGGERSLQSVPGGRNYLEEGDARPHESLDWGIITDKQKLENSVICLLYSSGTTGVPKGVNLSHTNLVSEALIPQYMMREFMNRQKRKDSSFDFKYRTLAHLPAAHIAGCQGYFVNPAVAGGPVFWMPKFNFDDFLKYNKEHKITTFFTVPPIYLLVAKSPAVTDQFKTLVHAITGAAPMGPELMAQAEAKLGAHISQTWGLSETTGSVTAMPWDEHDLTGSVSPLLPNVRMRIVDDNDNDVPEGEEGEFIMKGPMVTKGYWDNEKQTQESFTPDGWYKTGDIGLRRDNKFYIVDRKKELIKYKGLQVAPAELEALLLSHNLITDAAVIGVSDPDGSGNELPRAYVVADKLKISEEDIKTYIKKNCAQHKQLRGGVIWLDAIPKSPSGKILRRELREMAKREAKGQQARL